MLFLLVAFLLAFFAALAAASGRSVPQLRPRSNPIMVPIHIHSRGISVKVGWNASQLDVKSDTSAGAGLTPLAFTTDRQSYYTIISIGNIYFRVALDTASSDLWVMSTACQTNTCKSVPRYPLAYESPTFTPIANNATPYQVSYADGTYASGFVALETVQLANITVERQAFGMITRSNVTFTNRVSGIMGLGFPRLSSIPSTVNHSTPFFAYLAQQGLLDYPLFGVSLDRNTSGSLTIGAVDSSVVTNASNIYWNDVVEFPPFSAEGNSSSYLQWAIPISGFAVSGVRFKPQPTYPAITKNLSYALFDIGTAGFYGPVSDVSRLFEHMDGARLVDNSGQWVVPCDTTSTISLFFGEYEYILQPTDYLIGPASGNPNLCLSWPRTMPPSSDGIDWQIGSAFMATVYTIFSFGINTKEAPLIGLYPLSNGTNNRGSAEEIASFFSAESATIATTLPNFVIPDPTYTTPPYSFNSSIEAPVGGIVTSGLATSTYSPILGQSILNVTALPAISPLPTLTTLTTTNSEGQLTTSISTRAMPVVTLGVPPGWNGGHTLYAPCFLMMAISCLVLLCTSFHFLLFLGR